jgi:hypothetical protein
MKRDLISVLARDIRIGFAQLIKMVCLIIKVVHLIASLAVNVVALVHDALRIIADFISGEATFDIKEVD